VSVAIFVFYIRPDASDGAIRNEPKQDGSESLVDVTITKHEAGGRRYFSAVVRDRSERQKAEEAIRAGEALYRSIITAMAEGIVLQDSDGRILACNRSAERILGLTSDQIMGRTSLDPAGRAVLTDAPPSLE
jgi:PAS domain-containing protein